MCVFMHVWGRYLHIYWFLATMHVFLHIFPMCSLWIIWFVICMCRRLCVLILCWQNFINLYETEKSVTTANTASQVGCYAGLISTLYVACNASADILCLSGLILATSPLIIMSSWTSFINANHLMKLAPDSLTQDDQSHAPFISSLMQAGDSSPGRNRMAVFQPVLLTTTYFAERKGN